MMRTFILLLLLPIWGSSAMAQVSELGITGGTTFYIGDINPTRHYPKHTHLAGGLMYRYNFNEHYAVRLQGLYGKLEAYDRESDEPLQQLRNLGFRTVIFEASAVLEINFFKYRGIAKDSRNWTPFVFGGLAYFHYNPQNLLNDTWYDLQPLGTEGQTIGSGDGYSLNQICIPFGVGMKFAITKKVDVQLEWGLRRTYTDYLDDVSGTYADNVTLAEQAGPLTALLADPSVLRTTGLNTGRARGDSQTRDWYQYSGITISLLLTRFTECDAIWDKMKR
ncbi:MAG: porin family protein [Flavobacteriales bacterium]|nr:porin family protein [Flavobacteriales bacterium]